MELKKKLLETKLFKDNKYLSLYCKLIEVNRFNKFIKNEMQKHHIIPKSYYKYKNLKIDNSKENLVNLLYKDHVLAHYYLAKCALIKELSNKNFLSIKFIIKDKSFEEFILTDEEIVKTSTLAERQARVQRIKLFQQLCNYDPIKIAQQISPMLEKVYTDIQIAQVNSAAQIIKAAKL